MKMRRGRNGLTKAEFFQREIDEEVRRRIEVALTKAAEKKAKDEKENKWRERTRNVKIKTNYNDREHCKR